VKEVQGRSKAGLAVPEVEAPNRNTIVSGLPGPQRQNMEGFSSPLKFAGFCSIL
jgi:hypothetical protein